MCGEGRRHCSPSYYCPPHPHPHPILPLTRVLLILFTLLSYSILSGTFLLFPPFTLPRRILPTSGGQC
eukprot:9089877-Pyramimonas_sp.AAC.1